MTKQQICPCITLFCTFVCRRCTLETWKFLISHPRFMESVNRTQKLSVCFSKLRHGPFGFTSTKFRQINCNWIRSMKFEAVRIHLFLFFCHPKILLTWKRDVPTSPLYFNWHIEGLNASSKTQGLSVWPGEKACRSFQAQAEEPLGTLSSTIAVVYEHMKRTQEMLFADWAP